MRPPSLRASHTILIAPGSTLKCRVEMSLECLVETVVLGCVRMGANTSLLAREACLPMLVEIFDVFYSSMKET